MQEVYVSELVATLKKQAWFIVLLSVLAALVVGVVGYVTVPREWRADSTIMFEAAAASSPWAGLMREFGLGGQSSGAGNFETILRSRELRGRVVDKLNLVEEFGAPSRQAAIRALGQVMSISQPADGVLTVTVTWKGRSRLAGRTGDPAREMSARVCNEIIATLGDIVSELDFAAATRQRKFLEDQLKRTEQELLDAEDALVKYATAEGVISPSSQTSSGVQALQNLRQREIDLRVELQAAREREADALQQLDSRERMIISEVSERRDPQIDRLDQRIMELQRQIAEQMEIEGKSERHPDVARLQVELEQAQEQLAALLDNDMQTGSRRLSVDPQYQSLVQEALQSRLARTGLEAKLQVVAAEREAAMARLRELPAKTAQYEELRRRVEVKREALDRLTAQYESVRVAEAGSVPQFNVLDEAVPPDRPSGSSLRKTVMLTFILALMVSTLLAFWRQGRIDAAREGAAQSSAEAPEAPQ